MIKSSYAFQHASVIVFLYLCLATISTIVFAQHSQVETYVYKKVGKLEIKADVYRPAHGGIRPVIVSIHGGALIVGHREWIDRRMKDELLKRGYIIVSIDYRLAPETKLPDIIEDIEDAFLWVRREGKKLFDADVDRIGVMGSSAGGYLTLTSGFRIEPRPKVLVSFFGYGDLIGDWYSKPSAHDRHNQIKLTKEEASAEVSGPSVSDSRNRPGDGGAFYQHCRQHGYWPEAVSGWDPHAEVEKFKPYMPFYNVTKDYPPTALIHGTSDTDVPYEQSEMMAAEFKAKGISHEFITIPHAEHGLHGGDPKLIDAAYRRAIEFIEKHLGD
jgi:acetyl esterase/lipase